MSIEKVVDLITVLIIVAPIAVNVIKLIGAITHNKSIQTLADRYGVGLRGNRSNFGKSKVIQENEEKLQKEVEKNLESRKENE